MNTNKDSQTTLSSKCRAIFFDRDGVFNSMVERGNDFFVQGKKIERSAPFYFTEFQLFDGVAEFLQQIGEKGFLRVLATNQPDITYGTMPPEEHEKIMSVVTALPLDDVYVCTHGRNDGCECKKPLPGMLMSAAQKLNIDLASSFMVGDSASDIKAGEAAGCTTIVVDRHYNQDLEADFRVHTLHDILNII